MPTDHRDELRQIKTFPQLVKYLRDKLDWPIDSESFENLTFDYEPEELGLDTKTAAKIEGIKQLRPLVTNQPWGIFFVKFEPKRLPVVALRRILGQLVFKKRASANRSERPAWDPHDLLFISAFGEGDERQISFAHFSEDPHLSNLATLRVLGWDGDDTGLHLDHVYEELHDKLRWPDHPDDVAHWRRRWSLAFTERYREVITTSKDLALELADLARRIRRKVNAALRAESENGKLRKLMKAFQESLIHDLNDDDFADMYAQTIAYGLLSARVSRQSGAIAADDVALMVPVTNPFLRELMETFLNIGGRKRKADGQALDFDELGIAEVVEMLRVANMEAVLRDFDNRNPQEDPVIHFYELFLKEYDAQRRMERGVFYTPKPVVSYIVRSVDEILRTEFGLADGLADTTTWGEMATRLLSPSKRGAVSERIVTPEDVSPDQPFVQILDPAVGTGTFLVEVIDLVHCTMTAKWRAAGHSDSKIVDLWNDYVPRHLLPRLYGFELLMAPYAIAHMKVGLKLAETCYRFGSDERARIYLTNSLEQPRRITGYFQQMAPALAHEAEAANRVKTLAPTTVVLGNPPYSGISSNMNAWIDGLLKGQLPNGTSVCSYYEVDGEPLGEKKLWLQDDYVKFIRYAQWRIEQCRVGVLGYISNHGYLDNPTFRGMRQQLMAAFQSISVLDLHGSVKKREQAPQGQANDNVFDIEQGVAIALFRSSPEGGGTVLTHADLWGDRQAKYTYLLDNTCSTVHYRSLCPTSPYYFFVPRDESERASYECAFKLTDVVKVVSAGILTARDSLTIGFTPNEIYDRVKTFARLAPESARKHFELRPDVRDWKVQLAQADIRSQPLTKAKVVPILYRPFDVRYTYYTGRNRGFIGQPGRAVMHNMTAGPNVGIMTTRKVEVGRFRHALATAIMADGHSVSLKDMNYLFPFYLYAENGSLEGFGGRQSNLQPRFVNSLSRVVSLQYKHDGRGDLVRSFGPEDVMHFIYGQLHSRSYQERYAEFLRIEFPRVFVPSSKDVFVALCQLGADLVAFHLLDDAYDAASWNRGSSHERNPLRHAISRHGGKGEWEIAKGYPRFSDGRVYVNSGRWFDAVPQCVWEFQVGGYQVCEKWLKDRKGQRLSPDDVVHYQRIIVAISETIRVTGEIEKAIEDHGGWLGAFVADRVAEMDGDSVCPSSFQKDEGGRDHCA